jgi:DNA-binding Xre family transcriptional regulator
MADEIKIIFRLDEILAEKQRGVRELARATGIGFATISRIVNHHTKSMTLDVMGKICAELKIQPGELYAVIKKTAKSK